MSGTVITQKLRIRYELCTTIWQCWLKPRRGIDVTVGSEPWHSERSCFPVFHFVSVLVDFCSFCSWVFLLPFCISILFPVCLVLLLFPFFLFLLCKWFQAHVFQFSVPGLVSCVAVSVHLVFCVFLLPLVRAFSFLIALFLYLFFLLFSFFLVNDFWLPFFLFSSCSCWFCFSVCLIPYSSVYFPSLWWKF